MPKYQVICMSFDGDFQRERPMFETIDEAWAYSNNLGSKWIFFPFHFVVSGNKIVDGVNFVRRKIKTVQKIVKALSEEESMQGASVDDFYFSLQITEIK
jgi:hypothetical protein